MEGYNELAALMAAYPSLAIFRRFQILYVRDLLVMQAELIHLEAELKDIILEDRSSGNQERINLQLLVCALQDSANETERKHQWKKTLVIRGKLKQYCES